METNAPNILKVINEGWWAQLADIREYFSMCLAYGSLVSHEETRLMPTSDVELTIAFNPSIDTQGKRGHP